jgi:hypothetical protein
MNQFSEEKQTILSIETERGCREIKIIMIAILD